MKARQQYLAYIGIFATSLACLLLALLDVRRGFLFDAYPVRSAFGTFSSIHVLMVASAVTGMLASYRRLIRREADVSDTARHARLLGFVILALLVVDLLAYRAVPAARSLASGAVGADWLRAFGVAGWMRPVAQAASYLLTVWHATMLGILIAGLGSLFLPARLSSSCTRPGFKGSLLGAVFALPQPFCSCCSSVMAPAFASRGASKSFLLSFVIGAPMLNVTTMVLALALLPIPFALTRIVAGLLLTVVVTYAAVRLSDVWDASAHSAPDAGTRSGARAWLRPFDDKMTTWMPDASARTPSALIGAWLRVSGRMACVLVPLLWVWSIVASVIFEALPSGFGNNL